MRTFPAVLAAVLATVATSPAVAQTTAPSDAAPTSPPAATAPPPAAGATGNPNLAVASVKMANGVRASRIIGAAVFNEQDQRIGNIDDLMMTPDDKVAVAVVSVGGFLGIGSKLVAIPWNQVNRGQDGKLVLPGASKDMLNGMPNFTYSG